MGTVLEIFGGGRICVENKPLFCAHCDEDLLCEFKRRYETAPVKELVDLLDQRTARIVQRKWPNRIDWTCNTCGRDVDKNGGRK